MAKLFLILAFILIALGNDLFGFLKSKHLKLMGEISYSTYLLHGILIYISVHFVYGLEATKSLSEQGFCWLMLAVTPFLIGVSFITYYFIEKPFIERSKKIRKRIKMNSNVGS